MASGVQHKLLRTTAQKSNTAPISDANKLIHVQSQRFSLGEASARASVLIEKFDVVWSSGNDFAKLLTVK
ncbi:MAG: hypothetical protein WBW33_32180 [Bryobacteraceae bacterium]